MCVINGKNGKLTGFRLLTETPVTFTLTEFDMDVPSLPADANVYEEKDVAVVAVFTSPAGQTLQVDGFYFEEQEAFYGRCFCCCGTWACIS